MNINKYKTALINFGLKENEASVYVTNLVLGPTTILLISKETGIRRTTVYEIVKSLIAKGLITTELKGFKKFYCASHPQNLTSIFESKRDKFEMVIPELTTFYKTNGSESVIKTYESLDSIKSVYREILKSFKSRDFCYVVSDTDKFIKEDPKFFTKYIEERAKLNLDLKIIITDSPASQERKKFARNYGAQIKILPPETVLTATFTVTNNILLTQTVENQLMAITTNNKEMISLQKNLFELIWNSIKE
jgi:sugar-specific transcriptional regulator TrmB